MADYLDITGPTGQTIVDTIARAIGEAANQWSRQLQAVAETFARQLGQPSDMIAAHQKVGELAQNSVLRSYDQVVTGREGWAGRQHYRPGATDNRRLRYSQGVMRRALAAPDFFEATSGGINFVNTGMLNRRAKQWHRLNFGAGGAGAGSTERFQVTWGTVVVETLGFDEEASAGFVVPRGVWVGPEGPVRAGALAAGSDMFFPAGEARAAGLGRYMTRKPRPTRGIRARNFLDAGLRRMGRELPVVYEQLYREWWDQAQSGSGPLTQVTSTVPARPVSLPSRVRTV